MAQRSAIASSVSSVVEALRQAVKENTLFLVSSRELASAEADARSDGDDIDRAGKE